MKELNKIKRKIVPDTYQCDYCGKDGDITNMVLINGDLVHAKCYQK